MLKILAFLLALVPVLAQQPAFRYSLVNREIVEARLEKVVRKDKERLAILKQLFEEAGCALAEQPVRKARLPNVLCTLNGEAGSTIIVGGHFDLGPSGLGAVDNWSGASMLPSLYQALANGPRRHRFVFIGFTAEEKGLVGSRFYVSSLTEEETKRIRAMVNLDSLGLSSTKVCLKSSDSGLAGWLLGVADAIRAPLSAVNTDKVGTSDWAPFAERKIPTVDLHSVTQETLRILHSPRDRLDAIRRDDYYETYRLVAAYLTWLDQKLE